MPTLLKLREWVQRYLPLEIAGVAGVLIGGLGAAVFTSNAVVIAYAGTLVENFGFYAVAMVREMWSRSAASGRPATAEAGASAKALVQEFGPAELLDSIVMRPLCLYLGPLLIGDLGIGLIVGKVVADLAFFCVAVLGYERLKKRSAADHQNTA